MTYHGQSPSCKRTQMQRPSKNVCIEGRNRTMGRISLHVRWSRLTTVLEVNRHLKQQSDSACHGSPTTMCKSLRPALDNGSPPEEEESIGRPARAAAPAIVVTPHLPTLPPLVVLSCCIVGGGQFLGGQVSFVACLLLVCNEMWYWYDELIWFLLKIL